MSGGANGFPTASRGRSRRQDVRIGAVWVSLMEPDPGSEVAFNEWYGDDHFYAGGMAVPWIFAGRRWVCPRDQQGNRFARAGSTFEPAEAGRFLHLNFFSEGHTDDVAEALGDVIAGLAAEGRMYVDTIPRRHIYSRIQPYRGAVFAEPDRHGPLDIHALDYPFGGVVMEVWRAHDGHARDELVEWLADDFIPSRLPATGAELCLVALDADLPDSIARKTSRIPRAYGDGAEQRLTLLWFVEDDLGAGWAERFAAHTEVGGSAPGGLEFASPFLPVLPGGDRHVDELG